jgi:hypothetical protein
MTGQLTALQWEYGRICKELEAKKKECLWYQSRWNTVKKFAGEGHDLLVIGFIKEQGESP